MEKNIYNEDSQDFKDVKRLLKELPKLKAPDNFELNLMSRIHNQDFEIGENKDEFTLLGFLKPALAVSFTAVIVFLIIDFESSDLSNPLLTDPELREEIVNNPQNAPLKKEFIMAENAPAPKASKGDNTLKKSGNTPEPPRSFKVVINENDVISKESLDFPFEDKSIDLDSKLRKTSSKNSGRAVLAGSGSRASNKNNILFNGFYTRSRPNLSLNDSLIRLRDSLFNSVIRKERN